MAGDRGRRGKARWVPITALGVPGTEPCNVHPPPWDSVNPGPGGHCSFPSREAGVRPPHQDSAPNDHLTPPALWEPAEPGRGGIPWCKA